MKPNEHLSEVCACFLCELFRNKTSQTNCLSVRVKGLLSIIIIPLILLIEMTSVTLVLTLVSIKANRLSSVQSLFRSDHEHIIMNTSHCCCCLSLTPKLKLTTTLNNVNTRGQTNRTCKQTRVKIREATIFMLL